VNISERTYELHQIGRFDDMLSTSFEKVEVSGGEAIGAYASASAAARKGDMGMLARFGGQANADVQLSGSQRTTEANKDFKTRTIL
jgi:hypothetical protein